MHSQAQRRKCQREKYAHAPEENFRFVAVVARPERHPAYCAPAHTHDRTNTTNTRNGLSASTALAADAAVSSSTLPKKPSGPPNKCMQRNGIKCPYVCKNAARIKYVCLEKSRMKTPTRTIAARAHAVRSAFWRSRCRRRNRKRTPTRISRSIGRLRVVWMLLLECAAANLYMARSVLLPLSSGASECARK